jgi:hypothetical protein
LGDDDIGSKANLGHNLHIGHSQRLHRLDSMTSVRGLLAKFGHLIAGQGGRRKSGLAGWRLVGRSGWTRTSCDQEAQHAGHQGRWPDPLQKHVLT